MRDGEWRQRRCAEVRRCQSMWAVLRAACCVRREERGERREERGERREERGERIKLQISNSKLQRSSNNQDSKSSTTELMVGGEYRWEKDKRRDAKPMIGTDRKFTESMRGFFSHRVDDRRQTQINTDGGGRAKCRGGQRVAEWIDGVEVWEAGLIIVT